MKQYQNLSGDSGVAAYRISHDAIEVVFRNGSAYIYNDAVTGRKNVEEMKRLAIAGRGLATFIAQVVRERFAVKVR